MYRKGLDVVITVTAHVLAPDDAKPLQLTTWFDMFSNLSSLS